MTFLTAQARLDFSLRTTPLSNEEIRQLLTLSRDNTYVSKNRSEPGNYLVSMGESQKYETIVGYFADIITSRFDQDVSLLLVGNKGSGKSRAALSLCYFGACELVERLGGHWTDYFDPEVNMAVISPERAREVMNIKQKYAIKNFDDVGLAWGARNWQKKENIEKGEVFQISRIDNQLQIFSIPNQFLLDKVPRSLVSHYAEMDKSFFEYGFTTLKLFKPLTLFREGKILQPYLSVNKTKYVLYRIPRPPKFLDDIYTKIRREATTEAMKSPVIKSEFSQKPRSERKGEFIGFCIKLLVGGILIFSGVFSAGSYFTAEKLTGLLAMCIYTYQGGTVLLVVGILIIYDTIRWRKST